MHECKCLVHACVHVWVYQTQATGSSPFCQTVTNLPTPVMLTLKTTKRVVIAACGWSQVLKDAIEVRFYSFISLFSNSNVWKEETNYILFFRMLLDLKFPSLTACWKWARLRLRSTILLVRFRCGKIWASLSPKTTFFYETVSSKMQISWKALLFMLVGRNCNISVKEPRTKDTKHLLLPNNYAKNLKRREKY